MVANILPAAPPPPPPPPHLRRPKFIFFGTWVILHIKGNPKCSNMVSNADRGTINEKFIKPDFCQRSVPDPQVHLGDRVKGQNSTFQNMVMLHIKMAIAHAVTY